MHIPEGVHVLLFYGTQQEEILKARDEAVAALVPEDFRNENVTSHTPTANTDKLSLGALLGEIAGDLATLSFFPGAPKVVVVQNPAEIFLGEDGAKPKKGAAEADAIVRWIQSDLPETGNYLILLAFEDEGAGRRIDEKKPTPVFQAINTPRGLLRRFGDSKAIFKFEDALLRRDLNTALPILRTLWGGPKAQSIVFNKLISTLRFLMQSNIARDRQLNDSHAAASPLFPATPGNNLYKSADFIRNKYRFPLFRTADLIKAHLQLLDIYRAMRPRPGDLYVPDTQVLLEQMLLELFRSPVPPRGR